MTDVLLQEGPLVGHACNEKLEPLSFSHFVGAASNKVWPSPNGTPAMYVTHTQTSCNVETLNYSIAVDDHVALQVTKVAHTHIESRFVHAIFVRQIAWRLLTPRPIVPA